MNTRIALLWTVIIFVAPVVLSALFKWLVPFSIGPVVFCYSLLAGLALGYIWGLHLYKSRGLLVGVLFGLFAGVCLWVLLINYFITVTYIFGINDYAV